MRAEEPGRAIAARIEEQHPRWLVQFGVFSRQFIAVSRFGRRPLRLACRNPETLVSWMREAEEQAGLPDRGGRR